MEPYWLTIARAELYRGVYEIAGPESEARIEEYQRHSSGRWPHSDDDIAWCSDLVGWCIEGGDGLYTGLLGIVPMVGTKSAAARSWLEWGVGVSMLHPPIGAVAVLRHEGGPGPEVLDAPGHVTFFDGWAAPGWLRGIGGNQSNMVRSSNYRTDLLLGMRWAA